MAGLLKVAALQRGREASSRATRNYIKSCKTELVAQAPHYAVKQRLSPSNLVQLDPKERPTAPMLVETNQSAPFSGHDNRRPGCRTTRERGMRLLNVVEGEALVDPDFHLSGCDHTEQLTRHLVEKLAIRREREQRRPCRIK